MHQGPELKEQHDHDHEPNARRTPAAATVDLDRYDAVLFDLDGVLTSTASLHTACWKHVFDDFLERT